MEKKPAKKSKVLSLSKETLRVLKDPELREIVGATNQETKSKGLCCPEH